MGPILDTLLSRSSGCGGSVTCLTLNSCIVLDPLSFLRFIGLCEMSDVLRNLFWCGSISDVHIGLWTQGSFDPS